MPLIAYLFFLAIKNINYIYLNNIRKYFILVVGSLQEKAGYYVELFSTTISVAVLSHNRMT